MLKKKIIAVSTAALLTLAMSATAFAHDGWSQTNVPIIAQGEVSYVDLQFGNHSNEHKSYRITGQWNKDTSKVYVTSPSGKKSDITSTRFYTGEAATEKEPAVNNGFVATFSASSPGAYIVSAESNSINKTSASRSMSSTKSFVAVSDIPTFERVKKLNGFSASVTPDRAELIPLFNPAAVTADQQVSVQLILKGKPVAAAEVVVIRRSNSETQILTTNEKGIITFKTGPADYYLLRGATSEAVTDQADYKTINYKATATFTVQNAVAKLPVGQPKALPYTYLDGKLIETNDIPIQNGTTYAPASFITSNVDSGFTGIGKVSLRSTVEGLGAKIEYLPAVGDTRAAILIYTK
ncbi:MAG: DUF4198 domain-containing protein [Paenibacillaceae bacterium]